VGIHETYSKRLKNRDRAGQPDVYQYDDLAQPLRVKVYLILRDALGRDYARTVGRHRNRSNLWAELHDQMCRELGVFNLDDNAQLDAQEKCRRFLLSAPTSDAIDFIDMAFFVVAQVPDLTGHDTNSYVRMAPEDAIEELNGRFKEHGVGYQFVGEQIVRVDSQYVHAEVVKPAISLLHTAGFDGASEEFLRAHEHYRKGRLGEAMSDALKAFESTMKAICDTNGWSYREGDTAKPLIKIVLDNNLVPRYMETHLAGLRNTLEAGLPTVRNKNSGHGQGAQVRQVPEYFAGYALHLAATNIVFLVEAHGFLNSK
jgi:hypothetical protein